MNRLRFPPRILALAAVVALGAALGFSAPVEAEGAPLTPRPCGAGAGVYPQQRATYYSDPPPTVSQSGGVTNRTFLIKDLRGHAGYGQNGSGADILYRSQEATWSFTLPASINPATVTSVKARIALIQDDHTHSGMYYSLHVLTNGVCRADGDPGLPHGAPVGGPFTNWVVREYPVTPGGTTYSVSLGNATVDRYGRSQWYAVDWITLEITTQ